MSTTQHPLSPPPLDEISGVLQKALGANYGNASVAVVKCPDLRKGPFHLAAEGLSGTESVADIGGQPHLFPRPLLNKIYSLLECAELMELPSGHGMLVGAGAGPFHVLGKNSELAPNLSWQDEYKHVNNLTRYAMVESVSDGHANAICRQCPSTDCALMMNLYGSEGRPGQVLKVTAESRTGSEKSFTDCIRHALHNHYGEQNQISLGGVFVIRKGKALFHVMPDFPPEEELPWKDRHQLNDWLTYHNFSAPIVCLTVLHSADPGKLGLRMEHTHCFSNGKDEGGHYHFDLSAGDDGATDVEYEAYLNTAKTLYRIDKPEATLEQDLHE